MGDSVDSGCKHCRQRGAKNLRRPASGGIRTGVPAAVIKNHGAVSASVAKAMADGTLQNSKAQLAVAVTGIAGPAGGTKAKPVGLVYIAVAGDKTVVNEYHFKGGRSTIRLAAVRKALLMMDTIISSP